MVWLNVAQIYIKLLMIMVLCSCHATTASNAAESTTYTMGLYILNKNAFFMFNLLHIQRFFLFSSQKQRSG